VFAWAQRVSGWWMPDRLTRHLYLPPACRPWRPGWRGLPQLNQLLSPAVVGVYGNAAPCWEEDPCLQPVTGIRRDPGRDAESRVVELPQRPAPRPPSGR